MITPYVVFDLTSGQPLRWGSCQKEALDQQAGLGERALATSDLSIEGNRLVIWRMARDQRDEHIDGGAMTPVGAVDSDAEARSNITGAATAALIAKVGNQPYAVTWTLLDNTTATLDADGMIAMGLAVLSHVNTCHERARQLRTAIEAATNMAELLAIDVTTGWPLASNSED